ncbi:hypothetical protein GCM10027425_10420 [Alteromonas gracilis]
MSYAETRSRLLRIRLLALVAPMLASALLWTVRDAVAPATSVLVLVLGVVAAAATGDRVAGVLAALSAGAWFDFFLTRPYLTFAISDADDVETAVLLVAISLAVTEVALWGRRQQRGASLREGYLQGVAETARSLSDDTVAPREQVEAIGERIAQVLGASAAVYVSGPVHDARVAVLHADGRLVRGGRTVDVERHGLPTDEYVGVPVRRGPSTIGWFRVTAASRVARPPAEACRVALVLADQAGAAAERWSRSRF